MELPSLVTLYKKLQVAKAAAYTYSQDPLVRVIATQETRKEATQTRSAFKPYQVVVAAMQEDPGATLKQVRERAKSRVEEVDTDARLYHSTSISRQNLPLRDDSRAPQLWSATILTLTEQVLRFALNSLTDTLPHNANLHLWKRITTPACILCAERQTLLHVLNACPYALNRKRYNDRHDAILTRICQLSPSQSITADLPNQPYSFPQHVVCTDSRPNIVVWDRSGITIIELTVPFELCVDSAVHTRVYICQDGGAVGFVDFTNLSFALSLLTQPFDQMGSISEYVFVILSQCKAYAERFQKETAGKEQVR